MKRTTYRYQEALRILQSRAVSQGEPKIPNTPFPFVEDPAAVISRRMKISPKTAAQYLTQLEALRLVALARTKREISGVYILAKDEIPSPGMKSGKEGIIKALLAYKQFSLSTRQWWVSPDNFRPARIFAGLKSSKEFFQWIEHLEKEHLVLRMHRNGNGNSRHSRISSLRLTENFPGIKKA